MPGTIYVEVFVRVYDECGYEVLGHRTGAVTSSCNCAPTRKMLQRELQFQGAKMAEYAIGEAINYNRGN